MAERSLRGMKIGSTSLETDEGVAFVARQTCEYTCPNDHVFHLTFAEEADVPPTWECGACGAEALLADAVAPEPKKPHKPQRTHWDMLLERREEDELKVLLDERLELLRSGRLNRRGGNA